MLKERRKQTFDLHVYLLGLLNYFRCCRLFSVWGPLRFTNIVQTSYVRMIYFRIYFRMIYSLLNDIFSINVLYSYNSSGVTKLKRLQIQDIWSFFRTLIFTFCARRNVIVLFHYESMFTLFSYVLDTLLFIF